MMATRPARARTGTATAMLPWPVLIIDASGRKTVVWSCNPADRGRTICAHPESLAAEGFCGACYAGVSIAELEVRAQAAALGWEVFIPRTGGNVTVLRKYAPGFACAAPFSTWTEALIFLDGFRKGTACSEAGAGETA